MAQSSCVGPGIAIQTSPFRPMPASNFAAGCSARGLGGARIAVFGVSYKPDIGDIRESPALKIIELLCALEADLRYHDPHVPVLPDHGLSNVPWRRRCGTPTSR
jgi:UDP-N-acetyl-D-glucosamine dehydrogenase